MSDLTNPDRHPTRHQSWAVRSVAAALVSLCFVGANGWTLWRADSKSLVSSLAFDRHVLDGHVIAGQINRPLGDETDATVHPSLQRPRSWILATRSGCTTADLDGDGLPNDLLLTDPRLNRSNEFGEILPRATA